MDDEIGDHRPVGRTGLELIHAHAAGVELVRQGLGQIDGPGRRIGQIEAGRVQIAGDADEDLVVLLRGRADPDRDVLRQVQTGAAPVGRVVDIDRAAHVFIKGHDQPVAGGVDPLDRLALARADDQTGGRLRIGQPRLQVPGDDVAGLELLARRRGPVLIRRHHQLAGDQGVDVGLERQLQLGRRAVGVQAPGLALIEVDPPVQQHRLNHAVRVAQGVAGHRDVGLLAGEDLDRLIDRLAALQQPHGARIARVRQRALAEVARDQQGVLVDPAGAALGFGQAEAAPLAWSDEGAGHAVELAQGHRILAAVGQGYQAVAFLGGQAGRALIDPVGALGRRQGVEVQDRLPLRRVRAIAVQRRAAPDPAHVLGVLPEVVDMAVVCEAGRGDAVARLHQVQRLLVQALIARVALQHAQRGLVVRLDPLHGPVALDLFQPHIGVGRIAGGEARRGRGGAGGNGSLGHGDRCGSGGKGKDGDRRQGADDHGCPPTDDCFAVHLGDADGEGQASVILPARNLWPPDRAQSPSSGMHRIWPQALQWTASGSCFCSPHGLGQADEQGDAHQHDDDGDDPAPVARQGDVAEARRRQGGDGEVERVQIAVDVLGLAPEIGVDEAGRHEDEGDQGGQGAGDLLDPRVVEAAADGAPEQVAVQQAPEPQQPQEAEIGQPGRKQQGRQDEQVDPDDRLLQPVADIGIGIGPRRQVQPQDGGDEIVGDTEDPARLLQDRRGQEEADDDQIDDDDHQAELHRRRLGAVIEVAQARPQPQAVGSGGLALIGSHRRQRYMNRRKILYEEHHEPARPPLHPHERRRKRLHRRPGLRRALPPDRGPGARPGRSGGGSGRLRPVDRRRTVRDGRRLHARLERRRLHGRDLRQRPALRRLADAGGDRQGRSGHRHPERADHRAPRFSPIRPRRVGKSRRADDRGPDTKPRRVGRSRRADDRGPASSHGGYGRAASGLDRGAAGRRDGHARHRAAGRTDRRPRAAHAGRRLDGQSPRRLLHRPAGRRLRARLRLAGRAPPAVPRGGQRRLRPGAGPRSHPVAGVGARRGPDPGLRHRRLRRPGGRRAARPDRANGRGDGRWGPADHRMGPGYEPRLHDRSGPDLLRRRCSGVPQRADAGQDLHGPDQADGDPARPVAGLFAGRGRAGPGHRRRCGQGLRLHRQGQHGRRHLERHRHSGPRQPRSHGVQAGDGRQVGPVQALRRRRQLRRRGEDHRPGRVRHRGQEHRRHLGRHQSGGHQVPRMLRDRSPAAGPAGHPRLPRRPARHRHHLDRRPDQRLPHRRQEAGRPQGRPVRRRRGGPVLHRPDEGRRRQGREHRHLRPSGRHLQGPRQRLPMAGGARHRHPAPHPGRGHGRRRRRAGPVGQGRDHQGNGRLHGAQSDHLRHGQPRPGNHPGRRQVGAFGRHHRHRPLGLCEPGQQRPGLPLSVPRRAGRARAADQPRDEDRLRPRPGGAGARRRAGRGRRRLSRPQAEVRPGIHHPDPVRSAPDLVHPALHRPDGDGDGRGAQAHRRHGRLSHRPAPAGRSVRRPDAEDPGQRALGSEAARRLRRGRGAVRHPRRLGLQAGRAGHAHPGGPPRPRRHGPHDRPVDPAGQGPHPVRGRHLDPRTAQRRRTGRDRRQGRRHGQEAGPQAARRLPQLFDLRRPAGRSRRKGARSHPHPGRHGRRLRIRRRDAAGLGAELRSAGQLSLHASDRRRQRPGHAGYPLGRHLDPPGSGPGRRHGDRPAAGGSGEVGADRAPGRLGRRDHDRRHLRRLRRRGGDRGLTPSPSRHRSEAAFGPPLCVSGAGRFFRSGRLLLLGDQARMTRRDVEGQQNGEHADDRRIQEEGDIARPQASRRHPALGRACDQRFRRQGVKQALQRPQRPPGVGRPRRGLDNLAGLGRDQLARQGVQRAEQGVLGGGEADRRQAGHIGDQRRAGVAGGEVVHADGDEQGGQVMPLGGQPGEDQVGHRAHERADHHRADQAEAGDGPAADEDAQRHGDDAEQLAHLADLDQAEPQVEVERVHDVEHEVRSAGRRRSAPGSGPASLPKRTKKSFNGAPNDPAR
uniref:PE-PGRS family protein n=1 Tax=Parastrongyloides trichosuri TaxID=131310 RepID=A0A0N4ZZR6_PARTI